MTCWERKGEKNFLACIELHVRIPESQWMPVAGLRLEDCVMRRRVLIDALAQISEAVFVWFGVSPGLPPVDPYPSSRFLSPDEARIVLDISRQRREGDDGLSLFVALLQSRTMTASSSKQSSLSVVSLAPLGAIGVMLTPWGLSTLKALLLEPIRIDPPIWLRLLFSLLVITNIRSTPFAWHIRVLYPAFKAVYLARISLFRKTAIASSALTHPAIHPQLKLSHIPLGRDIFTDFSDHHFRATLDECDWNGHLSNSSYSRSLDYSRMAHNSPRVLKVYYDGGW